MLLSIPSVPKHICYTSLGYPNIKNTISDYFTNSLGSLHFAPRSKRG